MLTSGRVVSGLLIECVEIVPDDDTVTRPPDVDVDGAFCNVFTSNTFIGMPLLVAVPADDFAHRNCCGLKLNCVVPPTLPPTLLP